MKLSLIEAAKLILSKTGRAAIMDIKQKDPDGFVFLVKFMRDKNYSTYDIRTLN